MDPLVYIVRHGQTAWNAEYRLQGQADTDLNALGREQATRNGERLRGLISNPAAFDFVASPMRRTRQTMGRLRAAMGLAPDGYRAEPRLVEVHFGDWQGFTLAELEARRPGCIAEREADKWHFLPPGASAESYQMLSERVRPWLEAIDRPSVCVTHGGIIRTVFHIVEGMPAAQAAAMPVPQDRILELRDRRLRWL